MCAGDAADLKVKKTVIRMKVHSDVDLTNSTVGDALLKKVRKYKVLTLNTNLSDLFVRETMRIEVVFFYNCSWKQT